MYECLPTSLKNALFDGRSVCAAVCVVERIKYVCAYVVVRVSVCVCLCCDGSVCVCIERHSLSSTGYSTRRQCSISLLVNKQPVSLVNRASVGILLGLEEAGGGRGRQGETGGACTPAAGCLSF